MIELHNTRMGQKFFSNDIPQLIKAIEKVGKELERLNDNLEKKNEDKNQ